MNFGDNNFFMFGLNNHLKEENGNSNNNTLLWFSSWDSTTPPTSNSSLINTFHTTPAAEISAATGRHLHHHQLPVFGGDGSHVRQDPHLTCLHLGKRRCFEDTTRNNVANVTTPNERHVCADGGGPVFALEGSNKRGKAAGGDKTAPFPMVPRCQVEGCHVALCNAKDYHRRHRVCDMHSKAPKVVVLGLEQRFCQQCSRFHVMSAFDDSKRSCRRRLAGHNERRRKSTHSVTRNSTQGCALSLLSCGSDSWASHSDLSIRCNEALCELIEENRAAQMSRQVVYDREWHLPHRSMEDFKEIQPHSNYFPQQQMFPQTQ